MIIQAIKDSIWNCIKNKEVALFMIFSDEGEILFHQGRQIQGRTIGKARGFCRSYCLEALRMRREIDANECMVAINGGDDLSESALLLKIKQLLVFPVAEDIYFYLDSGGEPFRMEEIVELRTLGRVFSHLIREIARNERSGHISGRSKTADRVRTLVRRYAVADDPLLLLGETGVGKNRVARLIHGYSGRKGSFVLVHTPGVARELFESQLFGHRKGSFTGATEDTNGFVARAEGGTLFLDEIAELSPDVQAKLLRLIDEKTYTRLGDASERQADVRIVAATNRDLRQQVGQKLFRDDLYFRLNVLPILIPPLRERREDIPVLLADHQGLLRGMKLSKEAVKILTEYSWPGNIRELRSVLTRAGINHDGPEIGSEIADFIEKDFPMPVVGADGKQDKIWRELRQGKSFWEVVWEPFMDRELDREALKAVLARAYAESHHSFKKMLQVLNIDDDKYHNFMSLMYKYKLIIKPINS